MGRITLYDGAFCVGFGKGQSSTAINLETLFVVVYLVGRQGGVVGFAGSDLIVAIGSPALDSCPEASVKYMQ